MDQNDTKLINLPDGWKWVKLGEVCEFSQGIQVSIEKQKETPFNKSVRFLRIIDFTQNDEPPRYIEDPGEKYHLKLDDIAMVRYGTVGFVCTRKAGAIANNLFKITPKWDVSKAFLIHFFNSLLFKSNLETKGATMQAISFNLIKPIDLPLPPLSIQAQIVEKLETLLGELDKGKAQLLTAQAQLKTYRQAVLNLTFLKSKSELSTLSEIVEHIQIGPFGTQLHQEDYIENGIPLINPTHIKEGKIVADTSFSISLEKRNSLPNYILRKGDVIMGRRGEMGRCGLVGEKENGWFCGTGSLFIRPNLEKTEPVFLFYFLLCQKTKKYLDENAAGTTMANLNAKIVKNIPINLPPLSTQQKIVQEIESRLSVCDKLEETIKASLLQCETLRQSVLKRAFEGKLV